jgi:hypothetical protein
MNVRTPLALSICRLLLLPGVVLTTTARGADFSAWEHRQELQVPTLGLVKLSLPADTLDAAKPGLENLRLVDSSANEVPYHLERPTPAGNVSREAKSFQAILEATATVLNLETGFSQPIDGVTLSTPASGFIKAVQIDGSTDRLNWRVLAKGLPIFRQLNGASQLRVALPEGVWPFLKITLDDRQSRPVPFIGAQLHAVLPKPVPSSDTLFLETDNVDNPPIELEGFQFSYPATRLLFKAIGERHPVLGCAHSGGRGAARGDLAVVAEDLERTDRSAEVSQPCRSTTPCLAKCKASRQAAPNPYTSAKLGAAAQPNLFCTPAGVST